jgi:hypothetical protein
MYDGFTCNKTYSTFHIYEYIYYDSNICWTQHEKFIHFYVQILSFYKYSAFFVFLLILTCFTLYLFFATTVFILCIYFHLLLRVMCCACLRPDMYVKVHIFVFFGGMIDKLGTIKSI